MSENSSLTFWEEMKKIKNRDELKNRKEGINAKYVIN